MKQFYLLAFIMISMPVLAEDFTQTEMYKCIKKESEAIRKSVMKECGISESLLNDDNIEAKLTDTQKKCVEANNVKNQEKYKDEINKIMKKCGNL